MPQDSADCRSHCPINFVLETFGDRWTLLIVRDLMFKGKQTFGDFLASDEGIATNILAERLRRLEESGIVVRATAEADRRRRTYQLTEKGRDLLKVMLEITAWSARHDPFSNTPPTFLADFEKHRDAVIAKAAANLP